MSLSFDIAPFYDDSFSPGGAIDNNYMRILFRPGYAVQARELTALQSILQNQISTLGGFVFQDGSPVSGGHVSLDTSVYALQLNPQYANNDISLSDFLVNGNTTLVLNSYGNVKAYVVATDSTQANPVIIVKYITAAQFSNTDIVQVATGLQSVASVFNSNTYTNKASVASINEGVFYSGGFFVQVPAQTILLDSTTQYPNAIVGLEISENIINEVADSNLLDPAQGSFNYEAPGAERYQYELTLSSRSLTSADLSAFYNLLTVQNGLITAQVDYPVFADLDKSLAQRTFDTNGDFVVNPFIISAQDNPANTNQYYIVVAPGKAYVKGFEFETIGTQRILSDKARSTNTVNSYGMSLDFGNYVIAQNVHSGNISGIFDIGNFQSIDLHCVQSATVNTTNAATYAVTQIGTARVRDIEFLGLSTYYVYLTEINITSNSFLAQSGSNQTSITFPANYSPVTNAYLNVAVTVSTSGVVDTRYITNYASHVATLSSPLTLVPTTSSNVTLVFGFKDLQAGVVSPNTFPGGSLFATQNASAAYYACFDIAPSGRNKTANTVLGDTGINKLIYPLPQNFVAQGTISNASFETRKFLSNLTFTSGNTTISSGSGLGNGETFPYGYSGYLPDITANANFLVIVRNSQTSNIANGQIINFNLGTVPGGNGVYQSNPNSATIITSTTGNFQADVYVTLEVTNATSASVARRSKTLVGNSSNNVLLTTDKYQNGNVVIGQANVYIDTSNGYVWFLSNTVMAMTPGANQSLYIPDVFNVIKIYDSGNTAYAPNVSNNLIDITANYTLNSGQKDNYYNHAALTLKPGANPPTGQTVALIQYFQHDTLQSYVQGFFDADSYTANVYSSGLIPYYSSQNFGTISLRDSIDFRPTRTIGVTANVQTFSLSGLLTPYPDAPMILNFGYYLPRVDKLLLSKDKNFLVREGVAAQYPVAPSDASDAMTLYILTLPAYTGNVQQIQMQYVENKRYTMQEIGTLDTRITALEDQSALSALEQQATNENILYNDGVTAKDQYGIIADDFGTYSICDNQNPDLRCYMAQGSLTPYKQQESFAVALQSASGTYYQEGKCYCLPFTETAAVVQNSATSYISVQPFLFAQFKGTAKLTPQTTTLYSSIIPPTIIAPPASPAPDQPPARAPVAAPGLANNTPVQQTVTVVSTTTLINSLNDYWDSWNYINGVRQYVRIPRRVIGYGAISPFYNWFGTAVATTTSTTSVTTIPNSGSAIQLAAGTAAQTAISATQYQGGIHLFGLN